jgi:hypothetical protein
MRARHNCSPPRLVKKAAMPVELHRRYAAVPSTAGTARRDLRGYLDDHGLSHLAPTAALLVSELVSNAIVHAGGPLELHAAIGGDVLHVDVVDANRWLPGIRVADHGGRGLRIVDAMATRWGVTPHADLGKATWFELHRNSADPWYDA